MNFNSRYFSRSNLRFRLFSEHRVLAWLIKIIQLYLLISLLYRSADLCAFCLKLILDGNNGYWKTSAQVQLVILISYIMPSMLFFSWGLLWNINLNFIGVPQESLKNMMVVEEFKYVNQSQGCSSAHAGILSFLACHNCNFCKTYLYFVIRYKTIIRMIDRLNHFYLTFAIYFCLWKSQFDPHYL